jgi:hypothetical protein
VEEKSFNFGGGGRYGICIIVFFNILNAVGFIKKEVYIY